MSYGKRGQWRRWLLSQLESADPDQCWEWPFVRTSQNYGQARWAGRMRPATHVAHEFAFGFPPPAGSLLQHSCDNPPCVNPNHLTPGTDLTNAHDKLSKGRQPVGAACSHAKLTTDAVMAIYRSTEMNKTLAEQYGVDQAIIGRIRAGKIWKSVTGAPA